MQFFFEDHHLLFIVALDTHKKNLIFNSTSCEKPASINADQDEENFIQLFTTLAISRKIIDEKKRKEIENLKRVNRE